MGQRAPSLFIGEIFEIARPATATLAALLALLSAPARADRPYLDISGADFQPLPIAIDRFTALDADTETSARIHSALAADLAGSGLFNVLDPRSFLKNPAKDGFTATTIDFRPWTNVGADALVKAQISRKSGMVKAELKIFGVGTAGEELRKTYEAPPDQARTIAHRFADDLQKHFTGERGVFQTSIAFIRKTTAGKDVVVADFDGGRARAVVPAAGVINLLPSWSPDGRFIAFTSYKSGAPLLYRVDFEGRKIDLLASKGALNTGAAWSPDGQFVVFTADVDGNADIYRMTAAGTDLKKLTDFWGIDSSPTWSPDGKRIAFVTARSGNPQIYVMNADGTNAERLTFQGNYNQTPDWSPRGDTIAFTARDERNVFDLFSVDVGTKRIARLTQDQGNNEEPSWSPNGRQLAFSSNRGGRPEIYVMLADGSSQRKIVSCDVACTTPAWGPWTQ